ncbi:MAG: hypothetical protein IJ600_08130 [Lachnospiraceae bacterium]|nr:hypothetical protein [Lachnospiraceae bacterium]
MQKYKIGDYVMYSVSGACEVIEIGTLDFAGPDKIYYSLRSVYDPKDVLYVAVANEDRIARKVVDKETAQLMLAEIGHGRREGEMPQREDCDAILKKADSKAITNMIRWLRHIRLENRKNNKHMNNADTKLLDNAERVMVSELAAALEIPREEAAEKLNMALASGQAG